MQVTTDLSKRLPTEAETAMAHAAFLKLATIPANQKTLKIIAADHQQNVIEIPHAIGQLIMELLRQVGRGKAVTLVPFGAELTTQEAADMLNVSRPFLIQLLETGEIDHHKVGTHRRVKASEVIGYRDRRAERQKEALIELSRLGQEFESE